MRMCWYILGTCQLVKVFWYFRSNTFDECCQKKIWLLPNCCRYVFDYRKNLKKFLIVESVGGLLWLLKLLSSVVRLLWLLSQFSDCCQKFQIVVRIVWLLSCCQNFLIYVRIFWLWELLMDGYDCWSCCQVSVAESCWLLSGFSGYCPNFLIVELFPGFSGCFQNFPIVVRIFR